MVSTRRPPRIGYSSSDPLLSHCGRRSGRPGLRPSSVPLHGCSPNGGSSQPTAYLPGNGPIPIFARYVCGTNIGASHEGMPVGASAIGNGGAPFRRRGAKSGRMDAGYAMDRLDKLHESRAFHSEAGEVGYPSGFLMDLKGAQHAHFWRCHGTLAAASLAPPAIGGKRLGAGRRPAPNFARVAHFFLLCFL